MTDHFAPFVYINFPKYKHEREQSGSYLTKVINYKKLNSKLSNENWMSTLNKNDTQSSFDEFFEKLNTHIANSTSTNTCKVKGEIKLKPWITCGLIKSINQRNLLKRKLLRKWSVELEQEYLRYRNKLNDLIRKTKNDFYKHKIKIAKGNHN